MTELNEEIKGLLIDIQGRANEIHNLQQRKKQTKFTKDLIRWMESGNEIDRERIAEIENEAKEGGVCKKRGE